MLRNRPLYKYRGMRNQTNKSPPSIDSCRHY